MAAYLNCEICFRLWADYGAALSGLRNQAASPGVDRTQLEAAIDAIRAHEAKAHTKISVASSGY
jgi:hypothetical protein